MNAVAMSLRMAMWQLMAIAAFCTFGVAIATTGVVLTLEARLRARILIDLKAMVDRAVDVGTLEREAEGQTAGSARVVVRSVAPLGGEAIGQWNGSTFAPLTWGFMRLSKRDDYALIKITWTDPFACIGRDLAILLIVGAIFTSGGVSMLLLGLGHRRLVQPLARRARELGRQAQLSQGLEALAHDVRKPFSLVRALLDALSRRPDPQSMQTLAQAMLPELDATLVRVDAMVSDVLAFGREAPMKLATVTVEDMVEAALKDVANVHPTAQVALSYRLRHSRKIEADASQLTRVFANILGNAVEAMRGRGDLWLRTRDVLHARRPALEITFGNGGSFIPAATLARLFEPFFTTGKAGGTGLGLAIAKQTVERHGGTISVRSDAKLGTEFTLVLPVGAAPLARVRTNLPATLGQLTTQMTSAGVTTTAEGHEQRLRALRVQAGDLGFASLRLLVIDDDLAVRTTIPELLRARDTGAPLADVAVAATWNDAQALLLQQTFDLVICDYGLGPHSPNGLTILQRLREESFTGRFFLHTDRVLSAQDHSLLDRLGSGFLPKPAMRGGFLEVVVDALEARLKAKDRSEQRARLVVIDDDCFIRELWKVNAPEVKVDTFASPEAFLTAARHDTSLLTDIDAIVLDYYYGNESEMDGATFARLLRERTSAPLVLSSDLPQGAALEDSIVDARIGKDTLSWSHVAIAIGLDQRAS